MNVTISIWYLYGFRIKEKTWNHGVERVFRGHDPGPQESPGLGHLQADSGEYPVCQGDCEGEDLGDGGGHHGLGLLPERVLRLRGGQDQDLQFDVPAVVQRHAEGAQRGAGRRGGGGQDTAVVSSVERR